MSHSARKRVIVIGSSFTGLAAALELKRRLGTHHDVVVISESDEFIFTPSLVWVPFGVRDKDTISQLVRPLLAAAGVVYRQAPVTHLDLSESRVITALGREPYDYLVIATGSVANFEALEGFGPRGGFTHSISAWPEATLARLAFERFIDAPGPVIIGGVQGASSLDLAYEFLFAMVLQLRKRGFSKLAPLTFVTPEPYLGHLGRGDPDTDILASRLRSLGVEAIASAHVNRIRAREIDLDGGRVLPFRFAMLLASRVGVGVVEACPAITTADGLVNVDAWGRTHAFPNVFAAGGAVARPPTADAGEACGPPSGRHLAEATAGVLAANIEASIQGGSLSLLPTQTAGSGDRQDGAPGLSTLDDPASIPQEHRWLLPGPEGRWANDWFARRCAHLAPPLSRRARRFT